jgi:hypothetical protein
MPATLATCEVYGTIHDVFAQPVQGAVVGVMAVYKQGALVLSRTREVETDVDGYFTLELPRGPECVAILYANTPGLNISALGTPTAIPDADSAELTSIIGDFNLWDQVPVAIPIGAGVSSFNGRRGDVVLLSSDVTGALGYTPADAAALADYVPLAGGVMAGFLTLSGNPLSTFHAATKNYVDQEIIDAVAAIPPSGVSSVNGRTGDVVLTGADVSSALGYTPVNKAGDTMAGALILSADPLVNLEAATKHYVDIQIAAGGVNTAADYLWTGKHEFAGPSPAVRANTYATRVGGFMSFNSDSTISMNATSAGGQMQFNGPSGSAFRIDATSAKITHNGQIILSLTSLPAGGASVIFQCFDNSFIQRAHYFLNDSGRHFFNAPSIVDTGNAAVTIYADDTHGSTYGYALQCNGAAIFTGAVTLPSAAPVNATDAASKAYVDAHSAGVDLAANYNWTGLHTWTSPGAIRVGPAPAASGGIRLSDGAAGSIVAHSVAGSADVELIRLGATSGQIEIGGAAADGQNMAVSSYGRVGLGLNASGSSTRLQIAVWNSISTAIYMTDTISTGGGMTLVSPTVNGGTDYGQILFAQHDILFSVGSASQGVRIVNGYGLKLHSGDVTLFQAPTLPLHATTKAYVDGLAFGGGGAVDLAANYAWTGNHTWNKTIKVYTPVNGGGISIQEGAAGFLSPTLSFTDSAGTGLASMGVARTAGAFLPGSAVNDVCLYNVYGATYINFQTYAQFVWGTYATNTNPVTIGYNSLTANNYLCVGVPWVASNNARVMVQTTGMPEFALAFTNAVNASVNFQTQAAGVSVSGNASGKGASYITVYGDLSIARYVDQTTVQHWLYCRDIDTPPGFSTYCFGQAASPGYFFFCTVDGSTPLLAVHTNGDVTLAHDPTSALHAVTKQYSDSKLAKSGGTLTGTLTLAADPVNPLDAATKQYADTKVPKAGGTMTGLLTLSANPSGVLDAAPKQYVDLRLLKAGDTMTGALTMSNVSIIQNSAALGALTVGVQEELLTLATGALTTDTAGNLLPANSIILSVTGRITTAINNITNWKLGDATIADRFTAVSTTLTAGTTVVGLNMWDASRVTAGMGQIQAAAAKVRVTVTGTQNTTGAIRITTRYLTVAAATS